MEKYYANVSGSVKRNYIIIYFIGFVVLSCLVWIFLRREDFLEKLEMGIYMLVMVIGVIIMLPRQIGVIFLNKPVLILDESYMVLVLLLINRKVLYKDIEYLSLKDENDEIILIHLMNKKKPLEFGCSWISMTGQEVLDLISRKI